MLAEPRLVPPIHSLRSTDPGALGMLQILRGNALQMWGRRAYERPAAVGSFLGRVQVLLNDPEAIGQVLVRNAANYRRPGISRRVLAPLLGDGLLLSEGAAWKHQRRTIAPLLAPRSMPVLTSHVATAADECLARLADRTDVDLLPEMQRTALEIAGRSMFSVEMAEHGGPMRDLLMRFALQLARPSALDLLLPPSLPSPQDRARRQFRREWTTLIGGIVDQRAQMPPADGPRDLFDMLISARDPETGQGFSREQLCDQVATMILAGHETTALALFWSMALLAQAPLWQERVAAEAAAHPFGPGDASAVLPALHATRAVVSEALRLYPPAFMITREAIQRDVANRTLVPRGATVMIAPWVLHRHSLLWDDPHAFDPHRFMPDAPAPPRFAYLPFGAGPRICVAAQFAMAEAVLVLARLVGALHISSGDVGQIRPIGRVTTQPDRAAHFTLHHRAA
jgi:unspecific monooxygenase